MTAAALGYIGEVTYMPADFSLTVYTAASARLRSPSFSEDSAHVVFDGLAADEQAVRDLGVGEAVPEQLENLGFTLRQKTRVSRRRALDANRATA